MMALMALTACTTDEPETQQPMDFDNNQDLPMFDYDRTKDFVFWPTPSIDDSGLQGPGDRKSVV